MAFAFSKRSNMTVEVPKHHFIAPLLVPISPTDLQMLGSICHSPLALKRAKFEKYCLKHKLPEQDQHCPKQYIGMVMGPARLICLACLLQWLWLSEEK